MAEHTPTPWITQKCGELCPHDVMIVADLGSRNSIKQISTVAKALSMRQTPKVTAANAAFIVKAVNSHDALVKALTKIIQANDEGDGLDDCTDNVGGSYQSQFLADAIVEARAALVNAQPTPELSSNDRAGQ